MPLLSNPRRERFAQHVAAAGNGAAAYRQTYGAHGPSAETGASRLLRNAKVKRRVRELQSEAAKGAVMTLEEHRLFLAAVARGEHAEAKLSDKLRAIELDARLAGHLNGSGDKPTGFGPTINFNVPESFRTRRGQTPDNPGPYVMTEERRAELIARKRASIDRRGASMRDPARKEVGATFSADSPHERY